MLLLISSLGCASIPRPDTDLCGINAASDNGAVPHKRCYNIKKDYDDNGNRKSSAVPKIVPLASLMDLNKNMCTDPKGYENLLVTIKNLRAEYQACQNRNSPGGQ